MRKIKVSVQKKHIMYSDLWTTSRLLLEQGKGVAQNKSRYLFFSSIVFTSFALEAFLNHIGAEMFSFWDTLEKLSPRGKVNVICDKLKVAVDYNVAPWNKIPEIFGFRNKTAHGKTVIETEECLILHEHFDEVLQKSLIPNWSKYSTEENAESARSEVEKIMRKIFNAAGKKGEVLFLSAYSDVTSMSADDMRS